jgi:hypothetical protein
MLKEHSQTTFNRESLMPKRSGCCMWSQATSYECNSDKDRADGNTQKAAMEAEKASTLFSQSGHPDRAQYNKKNAEQLAKQSPGIGRSS